MALKLTVDTLDGIDESHHALYAEKDGKFHLDVDGVEDTTGLKSALDKERKANRELQGKIKKMFPGGETASGTAPTQPKIVDFGSLK